MSDPITLSLAMMGGQMALGAMSGISQHRAASAEAKAAAQHQTKQVEARDEQIQQNYRQAIESYRFQTTAEGVRMQQITAAARERANALQTEAMSVQGSIAARAADRGQAGQSLNLVIADIMRAAGMEDSALRTQTAWELDQSQRNMEAARLEANNRITAIQPHYASPVHKPSVMGTALQIGGSALGAFAGHHQRIAPTRMVPSTPGPTPGSLRAGGTGLSTSHF